MDKDMDMDMDMEEEGAAPSLPDVAAVRPRGNPLPNVYGWFGRSASVFRGTEKLNPKPTILAVMSTAKPHGMTESGGPNVGFGSL